MPRARSGPSGMKLRPPLLSQVVVPRYLLVRPRARGHDADDAALRGYRTGGGACLLLEFPFHVEPRTPTELAVLAALVKLGHVRADEVRNVDAAAARDERVEHDRRLDEGGGDARERG